MKGLQIKAKIEVLASKTILKFYLRSFLEY